MSRVLLIAAILLFIVFRRRLFTKDLIKTWFPKKKSGMKLLALGFVLGCLSLIVLIFITLSVGLRKVYLYGIQSDGAYRVFIQAIISGIVVAMIEEVFFRGFVLQTLLNDMKKSLANQS